MGDNNSDFSRKRIWLVSRSQTFCQTVISRFWFPLWWYLSEWKKKMICEVNPDEGQDLEDDNHLIKALSNMLLLTIHVCTEGRTYILLGYFYLESFIPLLSSLLILQHQFRAEVYSIPIRSLIELKIKMSCPNNTMSVVEEVTQENKCT